MKRLSLLLALLALTLSSFAFPRKFLLEQFTGMDCGYCPYGMDCIRDFVARQDSGKYVWLAHHYGYGTDAYFITANKTIGSALGVSGAPSASINRTKRVAGSNSKAYTFHPAYFTKDSVSITEPDTAQVSIHISRTYDATTHKASITVYGESVDPSVSKYKVCVYIKESGTVSYQHDYYNSWDGWSSFRHTKTVRSTVKRALGDAVTVDSTGHYELKIASTTIKTAWKDSNCCIVAAIVPNSDADFTILNCEQIPLVDGTDGGESIEHGGITRVPASKYYPEPEAVSPVAEVAFTEQDIDTENFSSGYVTLILAAPDMSITYGSNSCYPYLSLMVFSRSTTLSAGTYPITSTLAYGNVYAGFSDSTQFNYGGSALYYVLPTGYAAEQWMMASGSLVISADGSMEVTGTTLNGSPFHGTYGISTPIDEATEKDLLPQKALRKGQIVIERGHKTYDLSGREL